jgi:acetyl esterase
MPIDEATAQLVAQIADSGAPALHEMTPEQARAMSAGFADMFEPGPEMAAVTDHVITSADGGRFTVRTYHPGDTPVGVVVYFHGGGWVVGTLPESDSLARLLAQRTRCVMAMVDYRLAPEWPFPAAIDDAEAALRWVASNLEKVVGSDVPIIVAGDSAGGNLAAAVARRARDTGGPQLALQVLVYPVTDCDMNTASYLDPENQVLLPREAMEYFWGHYVPDVGDRVHPDASPLRADDFSGLPPALILTAEYDPLRDEGEAYADAMRAAGVDVEHHRHDGQAHGFFTLLMLPGHAAAFEQVVQAIAARTGGG